MTRIVSLAWLLAAAVSLSSCRGTTSQYEDPPAGAPDGLSYTDPNLFTQGVAITPLVPEIRGMPSSYFVTPDLPAGLSLGSTGVISGTPSEPRATATYLVTAGNSLGTSTFGVRITVQGRFTVGGFVTGLTGTGLVLTNNGVDNLAVNANGGFTFNAVYPVGWLYAVAVATQPTGQTCSVAQGTGYITNVNYGSAVVTCVAVTSNANRAVGKFNDAAQALANNRPGKILYLTCLDAPSPDSIDGFVVDEIGGFVTPLSDVIPQFPIDAALPSQTKCGPHTVTLDGAWLYVRNADTNIISAYATGGAVLNLRGHFQAQKASVDPRAPARE